MPTLFTHRPKIVLLIVLILLSGLTTLSAQVLRLQPLSAYQETLKRYHNRKWTADRKEFQVVNRKKWWYYLPTVGIQFGLPSVQFGTGTLAQIDRDKVVSTARLDGLDARAQLAYNEQLEELTTRYKILVLEIDALEDQEVVNKLETRILQISEDANKAKEIKPEVYLTELLKFQKSRLSDEQERRRIAMAAIELERFAHFNLTENELAYFDETDCEELAREPFKK